MGSKGIVASSAALGILLQDGIGDTIRISLTPEPGGDRTLEVQVAQELLQTMGFRTFVPLVAACPGCGRTTSTTFQELARSIQDFIREEMPGWKTQYPGVEALNVAVMGCIVNGPGESKHANIGISLARHRRNPGRAGVRRRQEVPHPARPDHCRRLQGAGDRLHRPALRRGRQGAGDGGGVDFAVVPAKAGTHNHGVVMWRCRPDICATTCAVLGPGVRRDDDDRADCASLHPGYDAPNQ